MGDLSKRLSRHEFACRCGCGFDTVDAGLIVALEDCADYFEIETKARIKIIINSGARCAANNKNIGANPLSQHIKARAADFYFKICYPGAEEKLSDDKIAVYLLDKYSGIYGIGRYEGRTHLDTRSNGPARWDNRPDN